MALVKGEKKGIKEMMKEERALSINDVILLHERMMRKYPVPKVSIVDRQECKPASRLLVRLEGLPTPLLDLYNGKIQKVDDEPDRTTYASFRTSGDPALVPMIHEGDDLFSVTIPKNALNGLLCILLPVRETFGPSAAVRKYPEEVRRWILGSNHVHMSIIKKKDCPSPGPTEKDFRYITLVAPDPLRFHFSTSCSVCPHGAIKVDTVGEMCYVDPYICKGQKYSNTKYYEEVCWDCFNEGDGTVSSKCEAVTLRKVVHMNPDAPKDEVPCCGGWCDMPSLCSRGAAKLWPRDDYWHKFYYVDKRLCNGCKICYDAFNCSWNCGIFCHEECMYYERDKEVMFHDGEGGYYHQNVHGNYTVRMTAHIDVRLRMVLVRLRLVDWWRRFNVPRIPDDIPFQRGEGDYREFDLIIWGDKRERIPIKLGKDGVQDLKMREIPLRRSLHMGLFDKDGRVLGFQYSGLNVPIRSLGGKRYQDPTKLLEGGHMNFDTPIGRMQLEYTMI